MDYNEILSRINDIIYIRFDGPVDIARAVAEIIIFSYFVFVLLNLVRETRAWQLTKGIALLLAITAISNIIGFKTISFMLNNTFNIMAIGILIIFQPELRRGLEQMGRGTLIKGMFARDAALEATQIMIDSLTVACSEMSITLTGALIVIERETKLGEIIETGIEINAKVTPELIINIFWKNTPLHDGAVVIRDRSVKAATCYLPLTESTEIDKELGTRHRAAIGMTEVSDAIALIVSEETGSVSFIIGGQISRGLNSSELKRLLSENLAEPSAAARRVSALRSKTLGGKKQRDKKPQGKELRGMEPQGGVPQGKKLRGMEPQGGAPQGEAPQGEEPQGEAPQDSKTPSKKTQSKKPQGMKP